MSFSVLVYRSFADLYDEPQNFNFGAYPALMHFLHRLMQTVVHSTSLGHMSDWDRYVSNLRLRSPNLLSDTEFLPDGPFREYIASSTGDALSRAAFVTVTRDFVIRLCTRLQSSLFASNSLARGLSAFDPNEFIFGRDEILTRSFDELMVVLVRNRWADQAEVVPLTEAYLAFLENLRSNGARYTGGSIFNFVASREELRVNMELHSLFCLISHCRIDNQEVFPAVDYPLPESSLNLHVVRTMVRTIQSFLRVDPEFSEFFNEVGFLSGAEESLRIVGPSFDAPLFRPADAISRSSRATIRTRLRAAFDGMVSRQEQSEELREVTSRPGFSVPGYMARSSGVTQSTVTEATEVVHVDPSPSGSTIVIQSSVVAEGNISATSSVVSAAPQGSDAVTETSGSSVRHPRRARKTVQGSKGRFYRQIDDDDDDD